MKNNGYKIVSVRDVCGVYYYALGQQYNRGFEYVYNI